MYRLSLIIVFCIGLLTVGCADEVVATTTTSTQAQAPIEVTPPTPIKKFDVPQVQKWKTVRFRGQQITIPNDLRKRCPRWEPKFAEYGLPVEIFSYIAWRESRCNPKSVSRPNRNGTIDHGLVQINSSWVSVTSEVCRSKKGDLSVLQNPNCNLKVAEYLLRERNGGLRNWGF